MLDMRKLVPDDELGGLIELSRAFFDEYSHHHDEFFAIRELRDQDIRSFFTQSMEGDNGATFVALVDGTIVGYITVAVHSRPRFFEISEAGAISGLMVHKAHRRRGIGIRLLAEALAFFKSRDLRYFTVYTAASNCGAIAFYEKNGLDSLYVNLIGHVESVAPALAADQ
jgi:ribosomal protein S18 acetylase RimI-like enzyme